MKVRFWCVSCRKTFDAECRYPIGGQSQCDDCKRKLLEDVKRRTEGPGTEGKATDDGTDRFVIPEPLPVTAISKEREAELRRREREKPTNGPPAPKASALTPRQARKLT